ncbi:hypothetical protein Tco_1140671 [Tanacetum coccineum]
MKVSTPMDTSEKLIPNNGQAVSQLEYSMVIGCLIYAMACTRPAIARSQQNLVGHLMNGLARDLVLKFAEGCAWNLLKRRLKSLLLNG